MEISENIFLRSWTHFSKGDQFGKNASEKNVLRSERHFLINAYGNSGKMFGADWLISSNPAFKNKTSIIQLSNFISKQLCIYHLFSSQMRLLWNQVWKFWVRAQPSVLPLCYHRLQAPQPPSTYYSRTFTSIIRISKYVHFQNHLYLFLKAYKIVISFRK